MLFPFVKGGASGICGAMFNVPVRTISVGSVVSDLDFESPLRNVAGFGYDASFSGSRGK